MKNKYIKGTHFSERKIREILSLFCLDIEAIKTADLTGISRQSINKIYTLFRERIADICESESPFENGEIELDESYFGARRVRGISGRGAKGKVPVFGMLKRGEKVYTQVVKSVSASELISIIKGKADKGSVLYTDGFKTYEGLADYGYKMHYRVKDSENEFTLGCNHINGIENFWGLCKLRLSKFRGVHKHTFYLHLKECEFRYSYKHKNIYIFLLRNIRNHPLKLS